MKVVYDVKLKRPACPIIQAALGGDDRIASQFDADYWLVHPTPDMKLYAVTSLQLKRLIKITKEENE